MKLIPGFERKNVELTSGRKELHGMVYKLNAGSGLGTGVSRWILQTIV